MNYPSYANSTPNPWYSSARKESTQRPLNPAQIDRELKGFTPVLEAVGNQYLTRFCKAKGISVSALTKMGAKVRGTVIAFPSVAGISYRDMASGRRWMRGRFKDHPINIVYGREPYVRALVSEGQSDTCALLDAYSDADVVCLPLGAPGDGVGPEEWLSPIWIEQLRLYPKIYIATDSDAPGERAWQYFRDSGLPCVRHAPPTGFTDWCEALAAGEASDLAPYRGNGSSEVLLRGPTKGGLPQCLPVVQPRRGRR